MNHVAIWAAAGWLLLHVAALVVAWGMRVAVGTRYEAACQHGFLLAMAAIGVLACVSCRLGSGWWVSSSIALVVMVLLAGADLRRPAERHPIYWS
jgi:hypothetical protein